MLKKAPCEPFLLSMTKPTLMNGSYKWFIAIYLILIHTRINPAFAKYLPYYLAANSQ